MTSFAQRCGIHDVPRAAACEQVLQRIAEQGIERVRIAWCDLHGVLRGKTLMAGALADALANGVGLVSTVMLKDTSDRTAFKVFEPGALAAQMPGFGFANNLLLLPDPASFRVLPWAEGTGWMQAQPWFDDATPVAIDTRRVLQAALARLAARGMGLRCGLEVEFHIYRIDDARLDPQRAAWPGEPPAVSMIHPGYNLLAEGWADMADEPLRIVQRTAQGLGLPLRSLEIELGPSQVEAVFDATDALTAADQMVLFRSGVRQALRRAGYHASFVCRPPFANVMASGWHLHQSLVDLRQRRQPASAAMRLRPAAAPADAGYTLSALGEQYLAGPAGACTRHGGVLHADDQRLRPLPAERAGAAVGAVGPRQPRCDVAGAGPMRRRRHAHREPHRRALREPLPVHRRTGPRRARRHRPRLAAGRRHRRALRRQRTGAADQPGGGARRAGRRPRAGAGLRRAADRLRAARQALRVRAPRRRPTIPTRGSAASTSAASEHACRST